MNFTGAFGELTQHGETALETQGVGETAQEDPHGGENGGQVGVRLGHDDDTVPAEEKDDGGGGGGGVAEVEEEAGQAAEQLGRIVAH